MCWVFSKFGFFSVVHGSTDARYPYAVRARVREDIVGLAKLMQKLDTIGRREPEVIELPNRDYPYRLYLNQGELEILMQHLARTCDYVNFKDAVKKEQGYERASLYSRVWGVMYDAEKKMADAAADAQRDKELAALFPGDDYSDGATEPPRARTRGLFSDSNLNTGAVRRASRPRKRD